jgi:hypothetical protein
MTRRVLALLVAFFAAQPSVGWAFQAAFGPRDAHCTAHVCSCKAARHCPPRKAAARPCHEAAVPDAAIKGACHHGDDAAPPAARSAYLVPSAPMVVPAVRRSVPTPSEPVSRLAGYVQLHSPPPKPLFS